jgi:hypothetical protein
MDKIFVGEVSTMKNDPDIRQALEAALKNEKNMLPYHEKGRSVISGMPLPLITEFLVIEYLVEKGEFEVIRDVLIKKYLEEFPREFMLEDFRKYCDDFGDFVKKIPAKRRKEFSSLFSYYENISFFLKHTLRTKKWQIIDLFRKNKDVAWQGGHIGFQQLSGSEYALIFEICSLCAESKKDEVKIRELVSKFADEHHPLLDKFLKKHRIKGNSSTVSHTVSVLPSEKVQDLQNKNTADKNKIFLILEPLAGVISFAVFIFCLFWVFLQTQNWFLFTITLVSLLLTMWSFVIYIKNTQ